MARHEPRADRVRRQEIIARAEASAAAAPQGEPPRITGLTKGPEVVVPAPTRLDYGFVAPRHDPIHDLPTLAAERLGRLRERSDDYRRRTIPFDEVQSASLERTAAANTLKRLTDPAQFGGFYRRSDDPIVREAETVLARATRAFDAIREKQAARATAWQLASAALKAAEDYLSAGKPGGTVYETVETALPKVPKNETVVDVIERLRRRCRELKSDAARIAASQYPAAESKARMREYVSRLAAQNSADVSPLVEHNLDIAFPVENLHVTVHGGGAPMLGFVEVPNYRWMFELFSDAIIKYFDDKIDQAMDASSQALSAAERASAIAEIDADIAATERVESAAVFECQRLGGAVEHRADIGALPLLGLRLVSVAGGGRQP